MTNIRIGIVGSGGMANRRADNFAALDSCTLSTIAARNPSTGPALAERLRARLEPDWRSLVSSDDVDAVVIATHNEIHGEIALAALAEGKHVFTEYPICRHAAEAKALAKYCRDGAQVIGTTHNENVSAAHAALKDEISRLGSLRLASFERITPGRGARPEVLFNLRLSGPPALFFVYQIHPLVDIFGPAHWVECAASYQDLCDDHSYGEFVNTLTVQFAAGGLGHWNWAGGVKVNQASQSQSLILSKATLIHGSEGWIKSTPDGQVALDLPMGSLQTLEQYFLDQITGPQQEWRNSALTAIDAARIGIAAERSATENRRIFLDEV